MNRPLSYIQYIKGNSKKALSLIISIAFSIVLIGSIDMFLKNSTNFINVTYKQYNYFTYIENGKEPFNEQFTNNLINNKNVEKIIKIKVDVIPFQGISVTSSGQILIMDRNDIFYVMNLLGIKYNIEDIPQNDENKIMLSEKLVLNNDFLIGQVIKKNLVIDKSIKTNYIIGFLPVSETELLNNNGENSYYTGDYGYLVIPKAGKIQEVNNFLRENSNEINRIYDLEYWDKLFDNLGSDINNLYNIITVIVLISIGLGLGVSTYVHYYQRRKEFGVLSSIGYNHTNVLLRINKEIIYTSLIALIIGLLLLYIEMVLVNLLLLIPEGVPIYEIDFDLYLRIIIIPLFTSMFSLIPTWILLKKLDSVSIIEGVK